ncbi:MAG: hypothetical protein ABIG34_00115 [Candidatus Peregrinibacteria bacterium]
MLVKLVFRSIALTPRFIVLTFLFIFDSIRNTASLENLREVARHPPSLLLKLRTGRRGVKGKALLSRTCGTPTSQFRILLSAVALAKADVGTDEEVQGRVEWGLARRRFGSTFVA